MFICFIVNFILVKTVIFPQEIINFNNYHNNQATQNLNFSKYLLNDLKLNYSTKENQTNSTLDSIYMITKLGGTPSKVQYFYNEQNKLTSYIYSDWDGNRWIIYWRVTNSYNTEGKIKTYLQEFYGNNIWQPSTKVSYNYNSLGQKESHLIENWDRTQWINSSMSSEKYDTTGNLIEEINENWVDTLHGFILQGTNNIFRK